MMRKSFLLFALFWTGLTHVPAGDTVIRTGQSGPWSDPVTWEGGKVPGPGARVLIRTGHQVFYDVQATEAIRALHVSGVLSFDADRDTRLDVGLIKIQAGDSTREEGFDCEVHLPQADENTERAAL